MDAPITRAGEKIAQARWKVYGRTMPPDATFTLRLAYGTVKGFPAEGTTVAPFTTFYGMLRPLALPRRQGALGPPGALAGEEGRARSSRRPSTSSRRTTSSAATRAAPSSTAKGEFVGIVFDGNIQSLAWDYFFTRRAGALRVGRRAGDPGGAAQASSAPTRSCAS